MFKPIKKLVVSAALAALALALPTSVFADETNTSPAERGGTLVSSKALYLNKETHKIVAVDPEDAKDFEATSGLQAPDSQASSGFKSENNQGLNNSSQESEVSPLGGFYGYEYCGTLDAYAFGSDTGDAYLELVMKSRRTYGIKSWGIDVQWSNGENDQCVGSNNTPLYTSYDESQTVYKNAGVHTVNCWGFIKLADGETGYLDEPVIATFSTT